MSIMLFIVFIAFLNNLALADLIFRINSDEFINSSMFKIVLTDSI